MNLAESRKRKNLIYLFLFLSQLPFIYYFFIDLPEFTNIWFKIANLTGFIGAVFLIWQLILGVRGFSKRITADYDWVIKIHTFLGINGALFVLLHPLLESIIYENNFSFLFKVSYQDELETFITYGRISFFLFLLIWISSSLTRKLFEYRFWLYIHYLSYPMIILMLIHPLKIGTILNSNPNVYYYWMLLCVLSLIIILFKILDIFNFTNVKYKLIEIKNFPGDIYTLKYECLNLKDKVNSIPGQYFYIKKDFIGEAHPFSVLEFNEKLGQITFGIKNLGKYTKQLMNSKVGDVHYIDGPFGEFTVEGQNENPKIILAGGIGITPFYELIRRFGNGDTYLLYSNKKIDFALYRDKFKTLLNGNYFDFVTDEKVQGENIICDYITSNQLNKIFQKIRKDDFSFFICGSPLFTENVINCLIEFGIKKDRIFIEEFEY